MILINSKEKHMYGPENIIWIKNVLRDGGDGWAYDNKACGEVSLLNWPTSKRGSAATSGIGDIIVLFQKPKLINGRRNYKVHLTHLVSPISNEIIEDLEHPDHKWCRRVETIAMANPINSIPNPGYFNFFLPNRGLTNPIINLTNTIGLSEAGTQLRIWNLFSKHFCPEILNKIYTPQEPIGEYGELEGDIIIREHIKFEIRNRNSKIVQHAKETALENGNGKIICECCDFDFLSIYGNHGFKYIECHHKVPISKGTRITTIDQLDMVCSNCHRMLHRKIDPSSNEENNYYSVADLRRIIMNK